jgi:hypothetical protein
VLHNGYMRLTSSLDYTCFFEMLKSGVDNYDHYSRKI